MTDAFETAVRADEQARAAHHRLDRMNGSIDKLRGEVSATNAQIAAAKSEISAKIDGVLLFQAHSSGKEQGGEIVRQSFLESRRFVLTLLVALLGGVVGEAVLLFIH